MPTLLLMNAGAQRRQLPLFEPETRIGRETSNDIVIYSTRVSRFHALLVRQGGFVTVRDLRSTNGTFVNGRGVTVCPLVDGDIVQVGDVMMRFFEGEADEREPGVAEAPAPASVEALRAPQPGTSVHVAWRLEPPLRAEVQEPVAPTEPGLLEAPRPIPKPDRNAPAGGVRGPSWVGEAVSFTFGARGRPVEGMITYEALADHFGGSGHVHDSDAWALETYRQNELAIKVAAELRYTETGQEPVVLRTTHF